MTFSKIENKPIEEARQQLRAEPYVWTDRMLTSLLGGVKNGKWHSLIDKVYAMETLSRAWQIVRKKKGAAGVDRQSIRYFAKEAEKRLHALQNELRTGSYAPLPVRRCWIDKEGSTEQRPLGIPAVRDRIIQTALLLVIGPIFEATFSPRSFGFRPRRGCKDALREVEQLMKAGSCWVVDADLKSYFDTIPHEQLMSCVEEHVADGRVLGLIRAYLKAGILDDMKLWEPRAGTPQGAVISPLLANLYLNTFDREMEKAGYRMIRYADDFVVLCRSKEEAQKALLFLTNHMERLGLQLHPDKTRLVDARERGGFDFLGYHFERKYKWPSKKAEKKLRATLRPRMKRTNGHSLKYIISDINKTLKGWYGYFKHSYSTTYGPIDGWVRGRLRAILRRRCGLRGRGRGRDHQRWPNVFFRDHGLFCLESTHRFYCQSLLRATH